MNMASVRRLCPNPARQQPGGEGGLSGPKTGEKPAGGLGLAGSRKRTVPGPHFFKFSFEKSSGRGRKNAKKPRHIRLG